MLRKIRESVGDLLWLRNPILLARYSLSRWHMGERSLSLYHRTKRPVLVLQGGKVGSQTIAIHLLARNYPTHHTHHVSKCAPIWMKNAVERQVVKRRWAAPRLATIRRTQNLVRDRAHTGIKVIVPIRDPIARSLSLCFHTLGRTPKIISARSEEESVGWLIAAYHERFWTWVNATPWEAVAFRGTDYFDRTTPCWLQRELIAGLELPPNFPACNLDLSSGFQIVSAGATEVLFIKTEMMDRCLPQALKLFLDLDPENADEDRPISQQNVGNASLYERLISKVRIAEPDLEHLLSSWESTTFFSERERDATRKRWLL